MNNKIIRTSIAGLADEVEGLISTKQSQSSMRPCFEYNESIYFIDVDLGFGRWGIIKMDWNSGISNNYYVVLRDSTSFTCDCQAARRGSECRHKQMIRMFLRSEKEAEIPKSRWSTNSKQNQQKQKAAATITKKANSVIKNTYVDGNALILMIQNALKGT